MQSQRIFHELEPVYDENSRVLILGSIPSPKSREMGFYYGHPQNRFWRVLAAVFGEDIPQTADERRDFALHHRIALWDVLASCEIKGADDASIREPQANDLTRITKNAPIRAIFCTGTKAYTFYNRFCRDAVGMDAILLPSTSPANCRISFETICEAYRVIREKCEEETI